ncbi:hypothetical protein MXB_5322 [Myxobolus squamalis]|nr:hypothetical protein MXB_5322 [Myxobolus squamalis]
METSDTPSSIRKLKVTELREKCQTLGLDNKGTKQILVDRIMSHIGFSADDMRELSAYDDSSNLNEESESKLELMSENDPRLMTTSLHTPKNGAASPENRFDLNASDSEKHEVELDFVNEDLQEPSSPNIEIHRNQQSSDEWDESANFIPNPTKIAPFYNHSIETNVKPMAADTVHQFAVKYMEHTHLDPCRMHTFNLDYSTNITTDAQGINSNGLCVGFSALESSLHLGGIFLSHIQATLNFHLAIVQMEISSVTVKFLPHFKNLELEIAFLQIS